MSLLIFDNEMYGFLQFAQRDSIIAALFLQGDNSHINDEGNYIKRDNDEIDVVSFLPKSKYEKVENEWENGRVKIKIGRFVRKFLTEFSVNLILLYVMDVPLSVTVETAGIVQNPYTYCVPNR